MKIFINCLIDVVLLTVPIFMVFLMFVYWG